MTDHTAERVVLATLPSGVEVTTTVHTYEGTGEGPTLYVQAAQHGREVNGAEVLRRLHDRLLSTAADLAGRVVAVPVADPLTFDRVSYTTPERLDSVNPNMNRVWPGDADGTVHERMAARLWAYAADADAALDLHTGGRDTLTHVVFRADDDEARRLAGAFGTDLHLAEPADDDAPDEWHDRDFGGKFRVAAGEAGVPTVTPELAHNRELVAGAVETGVVGVENVCRDLGLLPGDPVENPNRGPGVRHPESGDDGEDGDSNDGGDGEDGAGRPGDDADARPGDDADARPAGGPGDADGPVLARNHLGRVAAPASGLFRVEADLRVGEWVGSDRRVGTVYDPTIYEPLAAVETDRAGVLYALTREATVTAGDGLLSVAFVE